MQVEVLKATGVSEGCVSTIIWEGTFISKD